MNNKKGLSDVVTTVLIILLVLGAIVLLWQFLKPTLNKSGEQIAGQTECLQVDLAPVSCNLATSTVTVKVNKKGAATSFKVIVTDPATKASNVSASQPLTAGELATQSVTGLTLSAGRVVTVASTVTVDGKDTTCAEAAEKITC